MVKNNIEVDVKVKPSKLGRHNSSWVKKSALLTVHQPSSQEEWWNRERYPS